VAVFLCAAHKEYRPARPENAPAQCAEVEWLRPFAVWIAENCAPFLHFPLRVLIVP
jgi:hypothetical protein